MNNNIKFVGDFSRVNEEEREFINKKLEKFATKHSSDFSEIHLSINLKIHKETSRGRPAYYCKLNLSTDKGNFHAESQDFGAEKTISETLDKLDKQIEKSR